ncbi:MAG TPA: hypothetical protein VG942_05530 [Hyphomonadaceae bacterium]|nr:hypothetical protein [Hyphomonadaceae bacterium]
MSGSHMAAIRLPPDTRFSCCAKIPNDTGPTGTESRLRLWIGGVEAGPAHTLHETIRKGGPGFSHWGDQVLFSFPRGVPNDASTEVVVRYPYQFRAFMAAIPVATLSLGLGLMAMVLIRGGVNFRRLTLTMAGNFALSMCGLATVGVIILQLGLIRQSETFRGPFTADQNTGSQLKYVTLKDLGAWGLVGNRIPDSKGISDLQFWINNTPLPQPHSLHDQLRKGVTGYSHWDDTVLFALPPDTLNSETTVARADYPLTPRLWTFIFPVLTFGLAILLHRRRMFRWIKGSSLSLRLVLLSPYGALIALGWAAVAGGAAFAAIQVWAMATGEALTLALPFRSKLVSNIYSWLDPAIPLFLIILSMIGVALGWAAVNRRVRQAAQRTELAIIRWMRWFGLPVLAVYFLASAGASWAGLYRQGQITSFLGLVPYFDAGGYFSDVVSYLRDGHWSEFTSRRPLAGAFRATVMVLGDMRYTLAITVQTVALAAASYFACMSILRWRGVWAGMTFLALVYLTIRSQLSTTMTEPVSLIVAICAVPFFVEALRTKSAWQGLIGVFLMSAALWMRPGALFLIPALPLWFGLYFGNSWSDKAKRFAIATSVVLAMFAFDILLGLLFGSGSPGNFAFTICGLSIGDSWSACLTRFPEEYAAHSHSNGELIAWLYSKAIENLRHDVRPLLHIMTTDPIRFMSETPRAMIRGYSAMPMEKGFPMELWLLAIPVSYLVTLPYRNWRREGLFWGIVALAVISSTTIFYFTDGVRSFSVVYVLIAAFVGLCMFSQSSRRLDSHRTATKQLRIGRIGVASGMVALCVIPLLGRLVLGFAPVPTPIAPGTNERIAVVKGAEWASGVLVVADDQPLPHGVPAVHFQQFADNVRLTGAEESQGIITPTPPPLPFGFMIMSRVDQGTGSITLITPPEMVTRKDVPMWRVSLEGWLQTGKLFSENWFHVISAMPYRPTPPND